MTRCQLFAPNPAFLLICGSLFFEKKDVYWISEEPQKISIGYFQKQGVYIFMKIAIMGTGAMACLFGSRMVLSGHEVWMVSGWEAQVEQIRRNGLVLSEDGQETLVVHPRVTLRAGDVVAGGAKAPELVLISCKGYQTARTIQNALELIGPETRVLTLQNGMGNAEIIAGYVPEDRLFFGAASVGADLRELGHIKDTTNRNRSPLIGMIPYTRKPDAFCTVLGKLFESLGYGTDASVSAEPFVWKKLCINCCANAIGGISQLENSVFSNDPDGFLLISHACAEVCAVAKARGIDLPYEDTRAYLHFNFYNQSRHVSMCQDIHNRRPTEIDSINGAVVRMAREAGIPVPVNETLLHLVRLISRNYDSQWPPYINPVKGMIS